MNLLFFWMLTSLTQADNSTPLTGCADKTYCSIYDPASDRIVTTIPAEAKATQSGLKYYVLEKGEGSSPTANSQVTVHYTGWTMDGKMFDSSHQRHQPVTLSLQQVIQGWTEGVQLMKKGGAIRLWIPEEFAYKGQSGFPSGMLVFDIELLEFSDPPKPPTPLRPPAGAAKTTDNHPFLIYGSGSGTPPSANATVTLHYNVWSTTGELYQSTQANNAPLSLKVTDLQPEWKAVVMQMETGQRASIWHLAEPSSFQQQGQPSLLHELILTNVQE